MVAITARDSAAHGNHCPDVRRRPHTCVEGESGLRAICRGGRNHHRIGNRSLGELEFSSGARAKLFSGDQPDRLRGPQHYAIWSDELAVSGTPNRRGTCHVRFAPRRQPAPSSQTTPPGAAYPPAADRRDNARYQGQHLRQPGQPRPAFLPRLSAATKAPGSGGRSWRQNYWKMSRAHCGPAPTWKRTGGQLSRPGDDCGSAWTPRSITRGRQRDGHCRAAAGSDGKYYVLDDASINDVPGTVGRQVVSTYHKWKADRIIVERNQGGDMVAAMLRAVDAHLPITEVYATKGKYTCAEPVSALYEQGRVKHVGHS